MSVQPKVLPMTEAHVRLEMVQPRWWEWTLVTKDGSVTLGADVLGTVGPLAVERLSGGDVAGEVDGRQVSWVVSLAEKHHSLYVAVDGVNRLLYFQDSDGRIVWRDRLTPNHLASWSTALSATG